jgi:hypothetical protein
LGVLNLQRREETMKTLHLPMIGPLVVLLAVCARMAIAAQDRFTLRVPNGLADRLYPCCRATRGSIDVQINLV